jgi:hypothetical protein
VQQRLGQQQSYHQPQLIALEAIGRGLGAIEVDVGQGGYALSILENREVQRNHSRLLQPNLTFLDSSAADNLIQKQSLGNFIVGMVDRSFNDAECFGRIHQSVSSYEREQRQTINISPLWGEGTNMLCCTNSWVTGCGAARVGS